MHLSSWCNQGTALVPPSGFGVTTHSGNEPRPQCRRVSADLRTTNRLDARLASSLAKKKHKKRSNQALFQSPKRQYEYQGYRAITSDRSGTSLPILVGAAIIAAAILVRASRPDEASSILAEARRWALGSHPGHAKYLLEVAAHLGLKVMH
jgi:hypothetical protein